MKIRSGKQEIMISCKYFILAQRSEVLIWLIWYRGIRCMEHSVHVACKHFVEAVAPACPTNKINDWEDEDGDKEDGDVTDEADEGFTAGDALGKALVLVKQV
jgi:hypothetical protein